MALTTISAFSTARLVSAIFVTSPSTNSTPANLARLPRPMPITRQPLFTNAFATSCPSLPFIPNTVTVFAILLFTPNAEFCFVQNLGFALSDKYDIQKYK
ncbi:hypothetical protein MNBD_ALPHA11-2239 [hydrothermal vent metagenome]|uniref:Uncharacterized protein n=1 Tax=hydrothermal vent metagenome TaxID=652676 RepID=A0A3B0UP18_9ZZZZ